jgi:hypothetical protein
LPLRIARRFDVANSAAARDIGGILRNLNLVSARRERDARRQKREYGGRWQQSTNMHNPLPNGPNRRTHSKLPGRHTPDSVPRHNPKCVARLPWVQPQDWLHLHELFNRPERTVVLRDRLRIAPDSMKNREAR